MNEADIPIDIHTLKLQDWLVSRRIVPKNIQAQLKIIRNRISNALQDMPSNEQLIKLLTGKNINYYHCQDIVEILKQTEKDTKNVFGSYSSQRMKDWQDILRLYQKDNVYLAEAAQLYVRNVRYEIPNINKQMSKLENQSEECLKRCADLSRPETQLLAEHAALLQQLGISGNNLQEEFMQILSKLPELHAKCISNIDAIQPAIEIYAENSTQKLCLPILRHLLEFGNTTVYQYVHKEAPLSIEEPVIKLNLEQQQQQDNANNEIDFGFDGNDNDNGNDNGTSSSGMSAEMIDFGDLALESAEAGGGEIDWGIESTPTETVEINFDIPLEEYGIVVEGAGMIGGIAKGEQAFTLLDSPHYRDRFLDELYELDAFLRLRKYELEHLDASSNVMFSLLDGGVSTHDAASMRKLLKHVEDILQETGNEHTHHLFQLKHSPKYADLLASKLQRMTKAVQKIRDTKETLKVRAVEYKEQRKQLDPVLAELIAQTHELRKRIEMDISKMYKNREVNIIAGV